MRWKRTESPEGAKGDDPRKTTRPFTAFIKARVFNEAFRVVKTDRGTLEYVAKLTAFHAQFRAVGTNYNQVVKELPAHFSEKKTLALLYKLERATRELAAVGQQVVSLSEEFKQRW